MTYSMEAPSASALPEEICIHLLSGKYSTGTVASTQLNYPGACHSLPQKMFFRKKIPRTQNIPVQPLSLTGQYSQFANLWTEAHAW